MNFVIAAFLLFSSVGRAAEVDLNNACGLIEAVDFLHPKQLMFRTSEAPDLAGSEVVLIFHDSERKTFGVKMGRLKSVVATRGSGYRFEMDVSSQQAALIDGLNRRLSGRVKFEEWNEGLVSGGFKANKFLFNVTKLSSIEKPSAVGNSTSAKVGEVFSSLPADTFVVGGRNSSAAIRRLTEINGISIAELEKTMRPGRASVNGFLGKDESLLDVLVADNEFVLSQGLTHSMIAKALNRFENEGTKVIDGVSYRVNLVRYRGWQDSPFKDNTKTSANIMITNNTTGKSITFSGLLPIMIEKYGFYEGHGTSFRLDPAKILEVLTFISAK